MKEVKEMEDSNKEDLRIQYQQCIENYRMLDRHVWQVPSVTILIASAIVGVAFGYLKDALHQLLQPFIAPSIIRPIIQGFKLISCIFTLILFSNSKSTP